MAGTAHKHVIITVREKILNFEFYSYNITNYEQHKHVIITVI